jgi:hypothetical protein
MRIEAFAASAFLLVGAPGCFAGGTKRTQRPSEPPRIVPWSTIGTARLGMTKDRLEGTYGRPTKSEVESNYFPVGTRYAGKRLERSTYAVYKGTLVVWYVDHRAKVLETNSSRYHAPNGLRVGLRFTPACGQPGTACHWRDFSLDDCTGLFINTKQQVAPELNVAGASGSYEIQSIRFGDEDVLLTCF